MRKFGIILSSIISVVLVGAATLAICVGWPSIKASIDGEKLAYTEETAQEKYNDGFTDGVDSVAALINELQTAVKTNNTTIENLKRQVGELQTASAIDEATIDELRGVVATTQAANSALEAEIARLEAEGVLDAETINNLQFLLADSQSANATLNSQIEQLETDGNAARTTIAELQASVTAAETTNAALQARITELESAGETDAVTIANLRSTVSDLQTANQTLSDRVSELENNAANQEIIDQLQSSIAELETANSQLQAQIDQYQSMTLVTFNYNKQWVQTQCLYLDTSNHLMPPDVSNMTAVSGYNFAGWTKDGETIVDFNTEEITQNTNYYAMFKKQNVARETKYGNLDGSKIFNVGESLYCLNNTGSRHMYYWGQETTYVNGDPVITNKWLTKNWSLACNQDTIYIWNDGTNIYYECEDGTRTHGVLNLRLGTIRENTWSGDVPVITRGSDVYCDGNYAICWSDTSCKNYILDVATSTWRTVNLMGMDCKYVWTDGTNTYYTQNGLNIQIDLSTGSIVNTNVQFSGVVYIDGRNVVRNGNDIYLINSISDVYKLNVATQTWDRFDLVLPSLITEISINKFWVYDNQIYYSDVDYGTYRLTGETTSCICPDLTEEEGN